MIKVDRRKKEIRAIESASGKKVAYAKQIQEGDDNYLKTYYYTDSGENLGGVDDYDIASDSGFATGTVIPRKHPTAMQYLSEAREYNDETADIYQQIELSNKLYLWEGIVGTAIDILTEFAVTPIYFDPLKDSRANRILDFWSKRVNRDNPNMGTGLTALAKECALEWFVAGNVFPYVDWQEEVRDREMGLRNPISLPMSIRLLNPLSIKIPPGPTEFGQKIIKMRLSEEVLSAISSYHSSRLSEDQKLLYRALPSELRRANKIDGDGYVTLDPRYVDHIKRKERSYFAWGVPYLTKVFGAVAAKKKLRALDDSVTDGMINTITIFKVGDKDNPQTWKPDRPKAFANLLKNPTGSLTLVWSYDVAIDRVGPDSDVLGFDKKYLQADNDIKEALGIPLDLITGSKGSQDNAWMAILALIERLQDFRDSMMVYIEGLARKILEQAGFPGEFPRVNWANLKLRNERETGQLVQWLFQNGLVSYRTVLQESGQDFDREMAYREEEKKDNLDKVFSRRDVPYGTPVDKTKDKKEMPGDPEKKNQDMDKRGRPKKEYTEEKQQ
jgi:hypothetical protein